MIGNKLGSYQITHELGAGGMGRVFAAEHTSIGRKIAIKVLLSRYSRDKSISERFFAEAKAASKIRHPGIIDIFDFGWTPDGEAYIMMELLEGEGLRDRIKRLHKVPDEETLRLARQMANALAAAHAAGIVHRDLKPDNVFIVPDVEVLGGERVKLLDFGIAKVTGDVSKTSTGMILGSPLYMSPEQCTGDKAVDYRADIYSLGCVMFHMLCGRPPFTGSGSGKIIAQHIYENPRPLSFYEPNVPPEIEVLVMRALQKDPGQRFASMAEFEQALVDAGAASFTGSRQGGHRAFSHAAALPPTVEIATNRPSGQIAVQMPGHSQIPQTLPPGHRGTGSMGIPHQPHQHIPTGGVPVLPHTGQHSGYYDSQHGSGDYSSPTTLGSVASQITGASGGRGRGKVIAVLAVLVLLFGGGIAAWQLGGATDGTEIAGTDPGETETPDGSDPAAASNGPATSGPATSGNPDGPGEKPDSSGENAGAQTSGAQTDDISGTATPVTANTSDSSGDSAGQNSGDDSAGENGGDSDATEEIAKVAIRIITTKPKRAFVRDDDGKLLGETPLTHKVARDGKKLTFRISRDGYRDETVTVVADRKQTRRIKLRKERRGSTTAARDTDSKTPPPDTGSNTGDGKGDDTRTTDSGKVPDSGKKKEEGFGRTTNPFDD